MKIEATYCGKRKAIDTVEEGIKGENNYIKRLEQRVDKLEKELGDLRKLINDGAKNLDNEQDDWSDDGEESGTDDSDPWAITFLQLREYKILHGDCKVPTKSKDYPKLGGWVNNQRTAFRNLKTGKKGRSITPEKIIKLYSIGFDWGKGYPPPHCWPATPEYHRPVPRVPDR